MSKKAGVELQPAVGNQNNQKPFVLGNTTGPRTFPQVITQMRLARIQQMQSDIAYLQMQLSEEWNSVRAELLLGAKVEKGPLRAWIKCTLRPYGRAHTISSMPRSRVAKTLMVR